MSSSYISVISFKLDLVSFPCKCFSTLIDVGDGAEWGGMGLKVSLYVCVGVCGWKEVSFKAVSCSAFRISPDNDLLL